MPFAIVNTWLTDWLMKWLSEWWLFGTVDRYWCGVHYSLLLLVSVVRECCSSQMPCGPMRCLCDPPIVHAERRRAGALIPSICVCARLLSACCAHVGIGRGLHSLCPYKAWQRQPKGKKCPFEPFDRYTCACGCCFTVVTPDRFAVIQPAWDSRHGIAWHGRLNDECFRFNS